MLRSERTLFSQRAGLSLSPASVCPAVDLRPRSVAPARSRAGAVQAYQAGRAAIRTLLEPALPSISPPARAVRWMGRRTPLRNFPLANPVEAGSAPARRWRGERYQPGEPPELSVTRKANDDRQRGLRCRKG